MTAMADMPLQRWRRRMSKTRVWRFTKALWRRFNNANTALMAAGVAFFSLLAIFPGITAMIALAGLLTDPETILPGLESLLAPAPESARNILLRQIEEVSGARNDGLSLAVIVGLGVALFSASRGLNTLMIGLNLAYGCFETRSILKLIGVQFALTIFLIAIGPITAAILIGIPAVVTALPLTPWLTTTLSLIRWPIMFLIAAVVFSTLYRFGPARSGDRWRLLTVGGLFACVSWIAVTAGFSWYVQSFNFYNKTFGALGGVVILLTWMWLSTCAFLLGAMIDAELRATQAEFLRRKR